MYITPEVVAKEIGTSTSSTSFSEMEIGLGVKGTGLRQKETLANNKLQKMVADQTESEKRKQIGWKFIFQTGNPTGSNQHEKKDESQRDLDRAEPTLISTRASVKEIQCCDLDEVKGSARPPATARSSLEAVTIMKGQ